MAVSVRFRHLSRTVIYLLFPLKQAGDSIAPSQSEPYTSLRLAQKRHETRKRIKDKKMIAIRLSPFQLRLGFALSLCSLIVYAFVFSACKKNNDPAGVWRGLIRNNSGEDVAFTLEVKRDGDRI